MESIPLPNRYALSFDMNIKKMPKATSSPSQQNGGAEIPTFISVTKFKRTLNPSDFPRAPLPAKIAHVLSIILAIFGIIAIAVRLPEEKLWNYSYDMDFGGISTPMVPMVRSLISQDTHANASHGLELTGIGFQNVISLLWAATSLIFVVGLKKSLHPGLYIACDLIVWLALLATGLTGLVMVEVSEYCPIFISN